MSAKQVIDELREWLINMDKLRVPSEWMLGLRYRNELENLKEIITELEQKYCKEEKKGCYACSECGHPHLFEDLIYFEGNGEIADEL